MTHESWYTIRNKDVLIFHSWNARKKKKKESLNIKIRDEYERKKENIAYNRNIDVIKKQKQINSG